MNFAKWKSGYFLTLGAAVFSLTVLSVGGAAAAQQSPKESSSLPPQLARVSEEVQRSIDQAVASQIENGEFAGCVILAGFGSEITYWKAFGHRQLQPSPEEMKPDTVFDLASLTKPLATATCVMCLVQDGKLDLDRPVIDYLPEFHPHGKNEITVQQLLVHQSGLIPDNALADYLEGPEKAWQRICELKLTSPVGETFRYSDVNFIVLGKLIERLSGSSLKDFSQRRVFQPLGMEETGFLPGEALQRRAAATESRDGQWMVGQVHDPRAFALGGVAGHAGLFSTAPDLARYCQQALLRWNQVPESLRSLDRSPPQTIAFPLTQETLRRMTDPVQVSKGKRGLGWDSQSAYSSNRSSKLGASAFGHGGFTGTVVWIDPSRNFYFIFLSNRLHPDGKGSVNAFAAQLQDMLLEAAVED